MNIVSYFWPRWLKWCPTSEYLAYLSESKLLNDVSSVKELFSVPIFNKKYNIRTIRVVKSLFNSDEERDLYFSRSPAVLIHGMGAGLALFVKNFDDLAEDRQVYAFDLIGFGNSSRITFPNSPMEVEELFVESMEDWRKHLGIDKFILIGHSLGGFLAYSYAIRHSDRIQHLFLVDPWGFRESKKKNQSYFKFDLNLIFMVFTLLFKYLNPLFPLRLLGPYAPKALKVVRQDLGITFKPNKKAFTMNNISELSKGDYEKNENEIKDEVDDQNHMHHADNPESNLDAIFEYLYHINVKTPSGEMAFRTLSSPIGWAANPMINRVCDLDYKIEVTFIYGGKSWVDWSTGYQVKYLREGSQVNVEVIENAGHQVYAEDYSAFNSYVNKICRQQGDSALQKINYASHSQSNGEEIPS